MANKNEPAVAPIPVPPAPLRIVPSDRPFRTVRDWLRSFGPLDTILDVGCGTSLASTWGAFRRRYSIDPAERPELPEVYPVRGLFPDDWRFGPVDVILCLDVLPGLVDPEALARSLLDACDRLIVSVALVRGRWLASLKPLPRYQGRPESAGGYELQAPNPLGTVEGWFHVHAARWEIERTNPPRLVCQFARPRPLVIGQRVRDWRTNQTYRFERWLQRGQHRYAQVTDHGGDRHQLAEQYLRAG